MAGVPTVLFVFFEGLADTVVDSQVLGHARQLSEAGIAQFEILAFAWNKDLFARSLAKRAEAEKRAQAPVRVLRAMRPVVLGSEAINADLLRRELRRSNVVFQVLHARTDYSAAVCGRLKDQFSFDMIWDCRGDAVAEFLASSNTVPTPFRHLRTLRAHALVGTRQRAAHKCDRAAFVSQPLRDLCASELDNKLAVVTPCAASEAQFYFDADLRRRTRAKLGYKDDQQVFIYSGGLSTYQCFPESVALFQRVHAEDPRSRFLVLCPNTKVATRQLQGLAQGVAQVIHVAHEKVNAYLNAADTAFMLRKHDPLNFVASPTKFAEYCLTGLQVAMTNAVHDAHVHALRLGNLVQVDLVGRPQWPVPRSRKDIALAARDTLGKSSLERVYRKLYGGTA